MAKLFLLFSFLISFASSAQTSVKNVDAETFKKYIDQKKGVLIDLRTDDELAKKGTIKGAKQIDYFGKNSEAEISQLDKNKTYLIYCAGGGRSTECAELMTKLGFKEVINLEKGFDDWKRKGFPIETETKK